MFKPCLPPLRPTLLRLLSATGLVVALNAPAQAQPGAAAPSELFRALGGRAGLVVLMEDFMQRLLADPRMRPFFEEADQKNIKEKLVLQDTLSARGVPFRAQNQLLARLAPMHRQIINVPH